MELYEADIFTLDWLLDCIQVPTMHAETRH